MFDILKSLTRAAVATAVLPVDVVADVVTLGGVLTDTDKPYTTKRAEDILKNLDDAARGSM